MGISPSENGTQTDCQYIERNKEICVCTAKTCANVGICCDCVGHHVGKATIPQCFKNLTRESEEFRDHLRAQISMAEDAGAEPSARRTFTGR